MKTKPKKKGPTKHRGRVAHAKPKAIVRVNPAPDKPWLLDSEEVAIVKNSIAKGATDEELKFLLTVARRYRLDPFRQQIWFVKRWDRSADNGQGGKGAFVWSSQVGINGLLFAAARDHRNELGSIGLPEFGPLREVSDGRGGTIKAPEWARIEVRKRGDQMPTIAQAWWDEYAPADLSVAPFWRRMPRRMLAKCATALAVRQAYPDLGGLYIPEEMHRMSEETTPGGRQIVGAQKKETAEESVRELIAEANAIPMKIELVEWKDGLLAMRGDGIQVMKSEMSDAEKIQSEIKFDKDVKGYTLPAAKWFAFQDLCKRNGVEAILIDKANA